MVIDSVNLNIFIQSQSTAIIYSKQIWCTIYKESGDDHLFEHIMNMNLYYPKSDLINRQSRYMHYKPNKW